MSRTRTARAARAGPTSRPRIEDMRRKTPANMRECFGLIERDLFRGPWAMGEAYTVIDPYLFTLAGWLATT